LAFGVLFGASVRGARPDTAHAQGGQTWEVQVGGDVQEEFISSQRYYPNPITINVGDTVRYEFVAFHTVTFTGGEPLPPLALPGTEAGTLILNPRVNFSSLPPGQTSATYDGTQFINLIPEEGEGDEDAPPPSFTVTFTKAGTFGYFCAFHPGMRGEVVVTPSGAALPETPTQAEARGKAELEMTLAAMRAQIGMAQPVQPATTEAPGRSTTHSALAGLGSGFSVSALAFLPDRLTVRRGDLLAWTLADPFEVHTVTFTSGDELPGLAEPAPGPEGAMGPPTLVIPARVALPTGGDTYTGTGYLNSGLMFGGASFILRIDAPAGSYEYYCIIHPFMEGTITVTEP
jgi:plastocyanin